MESNGRVLHEVAISNQWKTSGLDSRCQMEATQTQRDLAGRGRGRMTSLYTPSQNRRFSDRVFVPLIPVPSLMW